MTNYFLCNLNIYFIQATKENATEIGDARTDEAIKNTIVLIKNAR